MTGSVALWTGFVLGNPRNGQTYCCLADMRDLAANFASCLVRSKEADLAKFTFLRFRRMLYGDGHASNPAQFQ